MPVLAAVAAVVASLVVKGIVAVVDVVGAVVVAVDVASLYKFKLRPLFKPFSNMARATITTTINHSNTYSLQHQLNNHHNDKNDNHVTATTTIPTATKPLQQQKQD